MGDNMGRNYVRSNNWCSQDGINQKRCGRIRSRTRSNHHQKLKRNLSSPTISSKIIGSTLNLSPRVALDVNTPNNKEGSNGLKSGLVITGTVIGSLIVLTIIAYFLIRYVRKRSESSEELQERDEEDEIFPPRELTINFVKHNHPIPELCTTPDTQPILDYYSSKAGLTDASSPATVINSNRINDPINKDDNDHKSTPVEVNENIEGYLEENINNEYVPQYYNGMEIPPLGARIIPLERQVQIAKEFTSVNLNPTNNKRKSNRSISSILSISSRRKSSTSNNTVNNHHNNNNNSSTTSSLTQIRETPLNENAAT